MEDGKPVKLNEKIPQATSALLQAFAKEMFGLFEPRYTELEDNKKRQSNPFAEFNEGEQTHVYIDTLCMALAQIGAEAAVALNESGGKQMDVATVNQIFSKKIKNYLDQYYQMFLQMGEDRKDEQESMGQGIASGSNDPATAVHLDAN